MGRYLLIRLLWMIPTFIGVTLLSFLIVHLAPGDPAELMAGGGLGAGAEQGLSTENRMAVDDAVAQWRAQFGLDRPLHEQYLVWLEKLVTLEFGESFKDQQPVWDKIAERLPITILLNALSILLIYLVALPLGIYSATHPYTLWDRLLTIGAFILFSLPTFWVAILAIVFLGGGDYLALFPPGGLRDVAYSPGWPLATRALDMAWHLFLPVLILSYGGFAELSRFMRGSLLEALGQNYVLTARAKGLSEQVVVYKHALRNSLVPLVTILAGILPALIGGSVIVESIFSIPGIGQLGFQAVLARDYPVIMAVFTMGAFITLISILLSDILLTLVDPRISFGRRTAA
ncbi:MAG: ABC transporter permease [Nitrospirae bacterium]|nr:ABC transporter permease [Nitrospirota bacterium]